MQEQQQKDDHQSTNKQTVEEQIVDNNKYKSWRSYQKITEQKKNQLLQQVFKEGKKIKQAAQIIGIKYGSAKTIVFQYRQQRRKQLANTASSQSYQNNTKHQQAVVRKLEKNEMPQMQMQISYAGEVVREYLFFERMYEKKKFMF